MFYCINFMVYVLHTTSHVRYDTVSSFQYVCPVLPEDGHMWPNHVATQLAYINSYLINVLLMFASG